MLPQVDIRSLYSLYYNVFALTFISTSLVIKLPFARRITGFPLGRLLLADAAMSTASSLLQAAEIPGAMILSSLVLTPIFRTNENAPIIWLAVISVTTVSSAAIEALVLHFFFAKRINPKAFCLLCTANAICLAGALYGMYGFALAHPPEA
jgi:hypothetical protein